MNKSKLVSFLFVILGLLMIVGSAYVIISYATEMMTSVVNFVTTNDFTKLQQCGITPPEQFNKLKNDLTAVVLPSLYIGLPLLLIILSSLMFLAGFYYHKGRHEEELKKVEVMEREMVHKVVKKMSKKNTSQSQYEEDEEESEDEEEEPTSKLTKRRK
ncbi:hypothetical protein JXA56_05540 [Candidatus Micrarchaeota archaeon]|nr:hypothetical protein [Candidatus Micrarchaeota archaeon]